MFLALSQVISCSPPHPSVYSHKRFVRDDEIKSCVRYVFILEHVWDVQHPLANLDQYTRATFNAAYWNFEEKWLKFITGYRTGKLNFLEFLIKTDKITLNVTVKLPPFSITDETIP